MHYLTVQDMLWINLQITKRVNTFNYAHLEEATFCQYAYGQSHSPIPQAARFVSGFLRIRPFSEANEPTAFVGLVSFLNINGFHLDLEDADASRWLAELSGPVEAELRVRCTPTDDEHAGPPNVRVAIRKVLTAYPITVVELLKEYAAQSPSVPG